MLLLDKNNITGNNLLGLTLRGGLYFVCDSINDLVDWSDWKGSIAYIDNDTIFADGYLSEPNYTIIVNKVNEIITYTGSGISLLDVNTIVQGVSTKAVVDSFIDKINEVIAFTNTDRTLNFEEMFLSDTDYIESKCRIDNGVLWTHEIFTNHVLVGGYETDTHDSNGQYILYDSLSLYNRDDNESNGLGTLVSQLTKDTVVSFAFSPTGGDWIPFHGKQTCWSQTLVRPLVSIDGILYDLYGKNVVLQPFKKIVINQKSFGILDETSPYPPLIIPTYPTDSVLDIETQINITPRRMNLKQRFTQMKSQRYSIGYTNMWSPDSTYLKYQLLQNGDKFSMEKPGGNNDYQTSIHDFAFLDDNDFGCAVITNTNAGRKWNNDQVAKADRYLNTQPSNTSKKKIYFETLTGYTPSISDEYNVMLDYVFGYSPTFKSIWNSAPEHTPPV
jgi:hypothetical protein